MESIQMHVLSRLAPLCGTGRPRCEELVGDRCAEAVREELGRISTFPAPWRHSLTTVGDSGSGIRRSREAGLPLPGRLCTQPGQTGPRLTATLAVPPSAGGGIYHHLVLLPKCGRKRE